MERSSPGRVILIFLTAFLLLITLLPLMYPYGSFTGLDGSAGVIDNGGRLLFADPLSRGTYLLGDLFCHQETARSFIINGSQTAFCQRDTSILAGVIIGLIATDKRLSLIPFMDWRAPIISVSMIISTFAEWGVEFMFGSDIPVGRIITGILAGAGIALLIQYLLAKEYEKVVFGKI